MDLSPIPVVGITGASVSMTSLNGALIGLGNILTGASGLTLNATFGSATDVPFTFNGGIGTGKNINFTLNFTPTPGTTLMVLQNSSATAMTKFFANLAQLQVVPLTYNSGTYNFVSNYNGGSGRDLVLHLPGTSAALTGLAPSAGSLSPAFASGTTSYTDAVGYNASVVMVTPTAADPNATIQVRVNNGSYATVVSGSPSGPLALNVGSNTIDVLVTSEDASTTRIYTIVVTRSAGNVAPVLTLPTLPAAIDELVPLSFTATATDANSEPLTFSLDAGSPAGMTIGATTGLVTWTPTESQGPGSYTTTVRVTDNGSPSLSDSKSFTLQVREVNAAPIISDIVDRTINEDANTGPVAFTVGDSETPAASLIVNGSSSNKAIVPDANIVFGGSGSSRTVTVTPAPNQNGTTTITVTVSDGTDTTSDTFVLTVTPVNDAPTISDIPDTTINEDTSTGPLAFVIGDPETAATSLTVSSSSSNTTLVPTANVVLGGTGSNRTVTVTPAPNLSGTSTITVTVSDGLLSSSDTFVVTVTAVNDAPTITDVADRTIDEDATTGAIPFTIGDVETPTASLTVTGSSSNAALVPNGNVVFGGSGANRTVTVTPLPNQNGTTTITVNVSDGTVTTSDTFVLTVTAVNDIPTISDISDRTINEDADTGAVPFTIGDVETPAASLVLTWSSTNKTLVPDANIVFGGSGANRTVIVTPAPNQNGTSVITVSVSDGADSASDTFVLTVTAVNDAPTISDITDRGIPLNGTTGPLGFTIGDVETAATTLTVSGSSSNTTLVPNANIVFGGSGANRTVTVTPAANQSGSATITVTVSDGALTANDTFVLSVAGNTPPTITDIPDNSINEDASTAALSFTVGDLETPVASLVVSGASSNTALVPNSNIVFGGAGAGRTVTVTPLPNQNGTTTITVTVNDGSLTATDTFILTVAAVNDAPTISDITDRTINEDANTGVVPFTISDVETPAGSLTLTGISSNQALVPDGNITFGGTGASRTLTVTPLPNQYGTATITVTVSDGALTATDTFLLTVSPVNDAPTISDITDRTIGEDTGTGGINFAIGDVETPTASLTVTGSSSNTTLVPNGNIVFGGSGANRTVTVTPSPNQNGTATITVSVSDGTVATSDTFVLTVTPVNDAPTISDIADRSINEDASTGAISFSIGDVETPASLLTVTGTSSNTALVPNSNIVFGGSGSSRTVTVTPLGDQNGTTTITVTVSDGSLTVSDTFLLTVIAVDDPPVVSPIPIPPIIDEDTSTGPIPFTVSDVDSPVASIIFTASSSNNALVPNSNIVFGGSGGNRTITITPAPNQSGTTVITVTMTDGIIVVSSTYLLTVNPVNDVPTISDIPDSTINEDAATGAIPFTIGDVETPAASLIVTGSSSNTALVPNGNVVFGGSGASRTVTVTPLPNQNGTTTITVSVSDGTATTSDTFVLTVTAVNDIPTISDISDRTINEDANTGTVPFTIGDVETPAASLVLAGSSTNKSLVPDANIIFGGSGANRTVLVTPAPNQNGTSVITISVSDGVDSASDTFVLTVTAVNDAPTISDITDRTVNEDTGTGAISFTISDVETPVASLIVTGSSSNKALVPDANIVFGGSDASRTVTVTPLADQNGTTTITVSVGDGTTTTSDTFLLTVTPVNDAPAISDIPDIAINEDASTGVIPFTVGDIETAASSLIVTGSSTNTALVPNGNIVFGGSGANRTVTVTPLPNQNGTTTITVSVSDGTTTTSDTFVLTVTPVNDVPTISDIPDQNILTNGTAGPVNFTVGDVETPLSSLTVVGSSSDTSLIPNSNIVFGGSGSSRSITITPAAGRSGTATITVTVNDGAATATDTFTIVVSNSAPEISVEATSLVLVDGGSTVSFGTVTLGGSQMQVFTIKNLGNSTLSGLSVTKDGVNASAYAVDTAGMTTSLAPGSVEFFAVTFTPDSSGTKSAALHIASNDADENPFDVALTGDGFTSLAEITSATPISGNTFTSDTVTFNWSAGFGVASYVLWVGRTNGGYDVFKGTDVTSRTLQVKLSDDGRPLFVTLYSKIGGGYYGLKYTFTAYTGPRPVKAHLITPVNGSALISTDTTFVWDQGVGVNSYFLGVGTTVGGGDVYWADQGTGFSRTVHVPTDKPIYVTLYSLIKGQYQANYYAFDPVASVKAALISPVNGSTLSGSSATFTWTAGVGVSHYAIWIGSNYAQYFTKGNSPLIANDNNGGPFSWTCNVIPQNGGPVYVSLYSLINNVWRANYYWFTTAQPASGSRPATLTSPTNETILTSSYLDLTWDAGVGVASYALFVGSTPGGYDIHRNLNETAFSRRVTVPDDGRAIFVTLSSWIGNAYQSLYYRFTAPRDEGASQIIDPPSGTTLATATLSLEWTSIPGASGYYLRVGDAPDSPAGSGPYIYDADQGTALRHTITLTKNQGQPVYVTLYTRINNAWRSSSAWYYTWKDPNPDPGRPEPNFATFTNQDNGGQLAGASTTFNWDGVGGASSYALWVGSSPGAYDLFASNEAATASTRTVNLPTDGRTIYVTLWTRINGAWQSASYFYTAADIPLTKAVLTSPVAGTTLPGSSATFTWAQGNGASLYALWIGRKPGGYDIYGGVEGTALSKTVSTLPDDGGPVYVTLWSLISGAWQSSEAVYQAAAP